MLNPYTSSFCGLSSLLMFKSPFIISLLFTVLAGEGSGCTLTLGLLLPMGKEEGSSLLAFAMAASPPQSKAARPALVPHRMSSQHSSLAIHSK